MGFIMKPGRSLIEILQTQPERKEEGEKQWCLPLIVRIREDLLGSWGSFEWHRVAL